MTAAIVDPAERNAAIFERRLYDALAVALSDDTALVVIPAGYPKQAVLNVLVHATPPDRTHTLRLASDALHFEGTRGSVRVYPADHVTYDNRLKRLRCYPIGVATFLHPEVDGL